MEVGIFIAIDVDDPGKSHILPRIVSENVFVLNQGQNLHRDKVRLSSIRQDTKP